MAEPKTKPFRGRGRRWRRSAGAVLAAGLALGSLSGRADSDDGQPRDDGEAQRQVEDLVVCYARGTDAIGSAVDARPSGGDLSTTVNLGNPQFAKGLSYYRRCFSKDFSFTLEYDGVPDVTVPDPGTRTPRTDAALQWANYVNDAFRGAGYRNTQHHMGSISSEVHGDRAHVESYLIATHAYGPASAQTGVNVVGGTYTDEVVREGGRWVIRQRTLNITSSVVIPGRDPRTTTMAPSATGDAEPAAPSR